MTWYWKRESAALAGYWISGGRAHLWWVHMKTTFTELNYRTCVTSFQSVCLCFASQCCQQTHQQAQGKTYLHSKALLSFLNVQKLCGGVVGMLWALIPFGPAHLVCFFLYSQCVWTWELKCNMVQKRLLRKWNMLVNRGWNSHSTTLWSVFQNLWCSVVSHGKWDLIVAGIK